MSELVELLRIGHEGVIIKNVEEKMYDTLRRKTRLVVTAVVLRATYTFVGRSSDTGIIRAYYVTEKEDVVMRYRSITRLLKDEVLAVYSHFQGFVPEKARPDEGEMQRIIKDAADPGYGKEKKKK